MANQIVYLTVPKQNSIDDLQFVLKTNYWLKKNLWLNCFFFFFRQYFGFLFIFNCSLLFLVARQFPNMQRRHYISFPIYTRSLTLQSSGIGIKCLNWEIDWQTRYIRIIHWHSFTKTANATLQQSHAELYSLVRTRFKIDQTDLFHAIPITKCNWFIKLNALLLVSV